MSEDSMEYLGSLIANSTVLKNITMEMASNIPEIDFVAANAPTGMVPGWQLRNDLEELQAEKLPYVYIRAKQKKGGHKENITGYQNNPLLDDGYEAVLVEAVGEDYNFTDRVIRSIEILRGAGYKINNVATILHPEQNSEDKLNMLDVNVHSMFSPDELEKFIEEKKEESYISKTSVQDSSFEIDADEASRMIINAGALEVRDLAAGEEPFLYSSGLWGPGYAMVKGLVGQPDIMNKFTWQLAKKLKDKDFDFIIGNITGGVVPGYQIKNSLEVLQDREIPYVLADGMRLLEGDIVNGNLIGDNQCDRIKKGDKALVIEELVNMAGTTTGSVLYAREQGYKVEDAATLFHYENPVAIQRMEENKVDLTFLTTLNNTLNVAESEELFEPKAVQDYRSFMADPRGYQIKWNLEPVKRGGTQ